MKSKKFWKLSNSVEGSGSKLYIDGPISEESWWGDEATPQALRQELKQVTGNKLEVVINSPGGDVWAGVAMYDALKELEAEVTVKVSGLAASIASVIAMAGDNIVMTPGSTMMIHKASMLAWGNSDDMAKAIEMLETVEDGVVTIYADRTGQTPEAVKEMMKAETWMSAEKAVELGFADAVVKPEASVEDPEEEPVNLFSGNFAFSMSATKSSIESFVNKVAAKTDAAEPEKAEPEPAADPEEEPAKATPEAPEEVEPEAEPTNVNEESEMNEDEKAKAIAKSQVVAKADPAKVDTPAPTDYLKTQASMEDFANVLAQNAGQDSETVRKAWAQFAQAKMGVTNPDVLLPDGVVTAIKDAFSQGGQIWNLVNKTGLDVFKVAWDTVTGEDSRAKGHKRGTTKSEEVITLDDRTIRPQFIYKYLTLDKETVRENRSTGALLRYVLSELPKRIIREMERAIVIGDGRDPATDDNAITSFVSIKADAAAGNTFAKRYVPTANEPRYEALLHAADLLDAEGDVYIVAKKGYLTGLKLEKGANGGYIFAPGADVASALEFAGKVNPNWLTDTTDPDNDAYLVVFDAYRTVGDNSIESFSNFLLSTNKNEYLQEIYHGGGLSEINAAVAVAVTPTV